MRPGRLAGLAALATFACLAGASAAPSVVDARILYGEGCKYVEAGPPGPRGNLLLVAGGGPLIRHGEEIGLDETFGCEGGRPTVKQVDRIVFLSNGESVAIDEGNGPFAPGATHERFGSEIEIEIRGEPEFFSLYRGKGNDSTRIEAGTRGAVRLDLNPAPGRRSSDWDMWVASDELKVFKVDAEQGDDLIDARQLSGVPDNPNWFPAIRLFGGAGDDAILAGNQRENLQDGPGRDLIRAAGGGDWIHFGPGRDTVYGGGGDDALVYEPFTGNGERRRDQLDRLFGGPGSDFLSDENGVKDLLRCGPGEDRIEREGRDPLGPDCEEYDR